MVLHIVSVSITSIHCVIELQTKDGRSVMRMTLGLSSVFPQGGGVGGYIFHHTFMGSLT